MIYRLTGIILRRRPIREANRLYTVYTCERGGTFGAGDAEDSYLHLFYDVIN